MPLTIDLPPEQEERLRTLAAAAHQPVETYARALIAQQLARPLSGAEMIAYWEREGLFGSYGDPSLDSPEMARQLRNTVWQSLPEQAEGKAEDAA